MKTLTDLTAAADAAANDPLRFFVRRADAPRSESTVFNTFTTYARAEHYIVEQEDLNPGVEFEIFDLVAGTVLD